MPVTCVEWKQCRVCGKDLKVVVDLGKQYVVDFVKRREDSGVASPLTLAKCVGCGLVQLTHTVNKERLFRKFWYRSGTNEMMKEALRNIVTNAIEAVNVMEGDKVLDIGANDCTLLGWYPGNVTTVGVEPCGELLDEGMKRQQVDVGLKGFFSRELVEQTGPFKVITAIAMFYDIEDPVKFLQDCKAVLTQDGVLIIQMNYLMTMLSNLAVDNICHEHLMYYSLGQMKKLATRVGMEIVGAEQNDVNGGSLRVYMTHKDSGLHGFTSDRQMNMFMKVMDMLHKESKVDLEGEEIYFDFATRVKEMCICLRDYLVGEAKNNERIYAYGASTRGTVLLQLLNLPDGTLMGVAERDMNKYGLEMVGGGLKIYPEEFVRTRASQLLLLPWHYKDGVLEREEQWMKNGGKLIVPLPEPHIIDGKGKRTFLLKKIKETGVTIQ